MTMHQLIMIGGIAAFMNACIALREHKVWSFLWNTAVLAVLAL